MVLIVKS
jgi:LysR family nitrogen assimilation transcriptional regulator